MLALVRPWERIFPRWLPSLSGKNVPGWMMLAHAWGAGTLLASHGDLFVGFGVLAASDGTSLTPEALWYTLFWGPWFMIGGILLMAAGWSYLRRSSDRLTGMVVRADGALGRLAVAGAPFIVSTIAAATA